MIVSALIGRTGSDILLDVGFVGSVLVTGYGMVKVAYARRMGKPLDTPVTRWLDIGVDVFANAIGALNKYRVARGQDPLLPHPGVVAAEARAEAAESQVADADAAGRRAHHDARAARSADAHAARRDALGGMTLRHCAAMHRMSA